MTREEAKLKLEWVHTDRETVYKNIDKIFDKHEVQLESKDEEIKELGEIVQQYLVPSKNYDAIIKAKDDEIRRLNNLYADTIKDLGDALIEIERLKEHIKHHISERKRKKDGKF